MIFAARKWPKRLVGVVVAACLPSLLLASHSSGDLSRGDLLVLLRALRQQYRTLSCRFKVETQLATEAREGKFYQAEDGQQRGDCRRSDAFDHDLVIKNGIRYLHNRFTRTFQISSNQDTKGRPLDLGLSDVWNLAGFRVVGRDHELIWLDDLLADTNESCDVRSLVTGDVILTHRGKYGTFVRTFARKHNYLPMGSEFYEGAIGGKPRGKSQVTKVREVKPGIYFPEEILDESLTKYQGQEVFERRTTRFTDIRINDPVPAGTFDLPKCPPGTLVVDAINQVIDQIDAQGQRVRTNRVFVDGAKLGNLAAGARQTEAEPSSGIWSIAAGVLSVAIVGLGIFLMVRRQRLAVAD